MADVSTLPELRSGMTVKVHEKITDVSPKGEPRQRVQIFEGTVLALRGQGNSRTARVLKDSDGWKVEKIFPLASPTVDKVEVIRTMKVRRAKIDYLKKGFKRKMKEKGGKKK